MSNDTTDRADVDLAKIAAERDRLRDAYLVEAGRRTTSSARGLHHFALLSSDVERTIRFYQEVLGGLHHRSRSTSWTPTGPAWSCWPTRSARCTA